MHLLEYIQSDKFGTEGGESNQLILRIEVSTKINPKIPLFVQEFMSKLTAEN